MIESLATINRAGTGTRVKRKKVKNVFGSRRWHDVAWIKAHWLSVLLAFALVGCVVGICSLGLRYNELKSNNQQLLGINGKLIDTNRELNSDLDSLRQNNLQLSRNLAESKKLIDSIRIGLIEAKRIIESAKHR
jgi:hypothetical protein